MRKNKAIKICLNKGKYDKSLEDCVVSYGFNKRIPNYMETYKEKIYLGDIIDLNEK